MFLSRPEKRRPRAPPLCGEKPNNFGSPAALTSSTLGKRSRRLSRIILDSKTKLSVSNQPISTILSDDSIAASSESDMFVPLALMTFISECF